MPTRSPALRSPAAAARPALRRAALLGAALLGATGCGPSLSDRPSDFVHRGPVALAVLCSDDELSADPTDAGWVKAVVRGPKDAGIQWESIAVRGTGAKAVRRAAGRVTEQPGGQEQRILTWWFVAEPAGGAVAGQMGPVTVKVVTAQGEQTVEGPACPVRLRA